MTERHGETDDISALWGPVDKALKPDLTGPRNEAASAVLGGRQVDKPGRGQRRTSEPGATGVEGSEVTRAVDAAEARMLARIAEVEARLASAGTDVDLEAVIGPMEARIRAEVAARFRALEATARAATERAAAAEQAVAESAELLAAYRAESAPEALSERSVALERRVVHLGELVTQLRAESLTAGDLHQFRADVESAVRAQLEEFWAGRRWANGDDGHVPGRSPEAVASAGQ